MCWLAFLQELSFPEEHARYRLNDFREAFPLLQDDATSDFYLLKNLVPRVLAYNAVIS